jgi:hydroxymethylpyrimidine pyrophosphatase-like HAD family hydrolase
VGSKKISLLLSDVDGTLVDRKKRVTARAKAAIEKVHEAGIKFAVTSGRPHWKKEEQTVQFPPKVVSNFDEPLQKRDKDCSKVSQSYRNEPGRYR